MNVAMWVSCRPDFEYDGALRDLIVPGTGEAEWEAVWAALRSGPFSLRAYRDGEPIPLPESVAWIMAEREVASVMVSIMVGTISANCHFFGGDFEVDIDPREITNEAAFESVLVLMRFLASAVKMQIFAVPEGCGRADSFLEVSPDGDALYIPPR